MQNRHFKAKVFFEHTETNSNIFQVYYIGE